MTRKLIQFTTEVAELKRTGRWTPKEYVQDMATIAFAVEDEASEYGEITVRLPGVKHLGLGDEIQITIEKV